MRGYSHVLLLLLLAGWSASQRRGRLGADVSQAVEFDCPEEFGYYPHPSDCTQYYVCVFGGALLESCTGGLMYSHELQTCDWPRNVGCGLEGESATVSTVRVTDSRTRQGPSTNHSPSRASVLSARVQNEQQKRQEDELAKHQLYAEDAGPAEEVEVDRQQRVYRGQPAAVGQVARDRDGLRHQPVTNSLPTSTGRVRNEEKIGGITYNIPQQAENAQYSYDELTQDYNTLTNETFPAGTREKRQVQYRLPSQAPVLQFVRSGLNFFFPSPPPASRPAIENTQNTSININLANNNNPLTKNTNFQPTSVQIFPQQNFKNLPRNLDSDLRPPDILTENTDYSIFNYQTSQNLNSPQSNASLNQNSESLDRYRIQSPPPIPTEQFGPFSSALQSLVKAFPTNLQSIRPRVPSPQRFQFEPSNINYNQPNRFPPPFSSSPSQKPIHNDQFYQSFTESAPVGNFSTVGWGNNFRGINILAQLGYNLNNPLFYSDFNKRDRSKAQPERNDGSKYSSTNSYKQTPHTLSIHSIDKPFLSLGQSHELSSVPLVPTESNFKPNTNAFGNDADSAENKNVIPKPIIYVGHAMPYQVRETLTTTATPEVVDTQGKDYYRSNDANGYQENLQAPVQSTDTALVTQQYKKPRRRRLRKPKYRSQTTTHLDGGLETVTDYSPSPGQRDYERAPEQFKQTFTVRESEFGPLYQANQYHDQKEPKSQDNIPEAPPLYFDSHENLKDFENPFARFDFDFDKFLEKLRGDVRTSDSDSTAERTEKTLKKSSKVTSLDEYLDDELTSHKSITNNEDEQILPPKDSFKQEDPDEAPLVTETEYKTQVPGTVPTEDIIYFTTQNSEDTASEKTQIRYTPTQHTHSHSSALRGSDNISGWANKSRINDDRLWEEQTTAFPNRGRGKNKSARKQNSSRVRGNNLRPTGLTNEKQPLQNYESSNGYTAETIQNAKPQQLGRAVIYDSNNNFNPTTAISVEPRKRRLNKNRNQNRNNNVQLTPSSLEYQETNEETLRDNDLYYNTAQVSQHKPQTTKHSPQILSYSEQFVTPERTVTVSQNSIKKNKLFQFTKSTLSSPITQAVPPQEHEAAFTDNPYTTHSSFEQLSQFTPPRSTKATLRENLDVYSADGDVNYNRYHDLGNIPMSQNTFSSKRASPMHSSSSTTGQGKYPQSSTTVQTENYLDTSDVEMVRDITQNGDTRGSKAKLMRSNDSLKQFTTESNNKSPLTYNNYDVTRTLYKSPEENSFQENDKNVYILRDKVTNPTTPWQTYYIPSTLPTPTKYNAIYADDSHIPIPTFEPQAHFNSSEVPLTSPPTSSNKEIYTNIPIPDDNSITALVPAKQRQPYLLSRGPTPKEPSSMTVTTTGFADEGVRSDSEQTERGARLDQPSTANLPPAADRGVTVTLTQRAPAAYNQPARGQAPLDPAHNQVAYNASRQEYDQQYDPYYSLYDEEDVELYRDVEYGQYASSAQPSRGQTFQSAQRPSQPAYPAQDVFGQAAPAQDYGKNYNSPADDQYQQNVAVQQPATSTRKVMRQRERGGSTQQTTKNVDSSHFDKLWTPALLSTQTSKLDGQHTQTVESRTNTNNNAYDYSTKPYITEPSQLRRRTQSSKDSESQTHRSVKSNDSKLTKEDSHRSAPSSSSYSSSDSTSRNIHANQIPTRSRGVQSRHPATEQSPTNFENIREQANKKDNSFTTSQSGNVNVNPPLRSNTVAEISFSEPRTNSNNNFNSVQYTESNSNFPTSQRLIHTSSSTDDNQNKQGLLSSITERALAKNTDKTTKISIPSRQPMRQTTERLSSDVHSESRTNTLSKDKNEALDSTSPSAPNSVDKDPSLSLSRNSIIQADSTTLRSRGRGQTQQRKQQTSSCSESFENNINAECKDKPQVRVRPVTPLPDTQSTPGPTRGTTAGRTRGSSSYTTGGASGAAEPVNRGTPASVRSRPTLKPSTAIVSKASEFIDIYRFPPTRPEPVYPTPQPDKTAAKCRKDVCLLPDCSCGGKDIPGGLAAEEVPQIVLLTFDDAVNDLNKGLYSDLFEKGRKNPNGCPVTATFYVSHEWTDYSQVQNLYAEGHEMASHSVSHSFGEKFSQKKWTKEIAGQREILSAYGGVRLEDIRGMRAPFLAVGGNKMFKMLYDSNFTYDSSMPVYENKPPSWPYTLDYKLFHDCMIPPCPTRSYPGVWEVPMVMWQDLNGGRCSMGDACSNPPTADGVYKMLIKNFERHYTTNRAPFGLFYHAAWFTQPHHKEGFIAFMDTIVAMQDVWLVTNWQAIQWVRDPTPLSRINNFQPFQCNYPERPKKCNNPKVCNLWHKSGVRYMRTCQPCPDIYPWTGKTGIRNSRVDNEIVEES